MPAGLLARLRHSRPVGLVRYRLYRDSLLAWPRRKACNVCGWQGRRFLTFGHRHVMCPACGSLVRHRLIAAAIRYHPIAARLPLDGRVLHISPEYCVSLLLRDRASHYVRGDWAANDCDVKQDITALPFADGCFDVIVACDTLEHVLDDRAALRECARVLRRNGIAILTVPQADTEYRTDEDESVTAPAEREARFGQSDHVRNYGADFIDRIEAAGLRATCIDASAFDPAVVERHVLGPPMPLSTPWGWNRRRVYVGEAE